MKFGMLAHFKKIFTFIIILFLLISCSNKVVYGPKKGELWRAIHLLGYDNDVHLNELEKEIPFLLKKGINVIILEVGYNFNFKTDPDLKNSNNVITIEGAKKIKEICNKNNIKLIPQFQCFGHQSWESVTFPLLKKYPHFDLTPGAFPNNEGIYTREWDPTNPEVYQIVFKLIDEIIDAFDADAFHVGMDEVLLINSEYAINTNKLNPANVYAKAVNDIYQHIVKKRGLEMLMWGDRLIDANIYDYGDWEASANGTAPAIDLIPKDIIICDWHYEIREDYPSIEMFIEKGFRVLPASWKNPEATEKLIVSSMKSLSNKMLGHLFTTWQRKDLYNYESLLEGTKLIDSIIIKENRK